MPDYTVEMLVGEEAFSLGTTSDGTGIEIAVEPVSTIKNTLPDSSVIEVEGPPQVPWQIGGSDPTSNPAVLVWFDIP